MTHKKTGRFFPFHPALFALYPVLSLLATNLDQVPAQTALRAGIISLAGGCILFIILRLILRDSGKAALLTTFWLALFFSYGHIYQVVEGKALAGFVYGKHRYLAALWALVFLAGSAWILKKLKVTARIKPGVEHHQHRVDPLSAVANWDLYSPPSADIDSITGRAGGCEYS